MSDGWLDRAKEEAKKLADAAKNVNYGEVFDKTKAMAQQAAEEAKKAASSVGSVISKVKENEAQVAQQAPQQPVPSTEAGSSSADPTKLIACQQQLQKVETLLQEIKALLKS